MTTTLTAGLNALDLNVTPTQLEQLKKYGDLIKRWNPKINLVKVHDESQWLSHHLFDALAINPYLKGERILDVGTGAGLPGIPLAIVNPDKHFDLLDSQSKKIHFLRQVKVQLGLSNVTLHDKRAEAHQADPGYTTITCRALTTLTDFVTLTKHLLAPSGIFIAMKGQYPTQELAAFKNQGKVLKIIKLQVPTLNAERHAILLGR